MTILSLQPVTSLLMSLQLGHLAVRTTATNRQTETRMSLQKHGVSGAPRPASRGRLHGSPSPCPEPPRWPLCTNQSPLPPNPQKSISRSFRTLFNCRKGLRLFHPPTSPRAGNGPPSPHQKLWRSSHHLGSCSKAPQQEVLKNILKITLKSFHKM